MNRSVQEILDDLSYSMASPEADAIYYDMKIGDYKEARKMLKKYLDKDELDLVINFFKNKNNTKYQLVEIKASDITPNDYSANYLFKLGTSLIQSNVYGPGEISSTLNEPSFYAEHDWHPIEKAQQIWRINLTI